MFTKTEIKEFVDELWGGKVELSITIKKLSKFEMDQDLKKSLSLIKEVDKKDLEVFMKAAETGDVSEIFMNVNNPETLTIFLEHSEENIRKCIHDMSYVETQDDKESENLSGPENIDKIFKKLDKDHRKWVSEICKKYNPELFGDKGSEEKKN